MKNTSQLKKILKDLFLSQRMAVLATQENGQPYGNLVAFVATKDLKYLLFATARASRKYTNITIDPRVSMVMDNRTNQETDFQKAIVATAMGIVEEVKGTERNRFLKLYLSKHPYLEDFVKSPTSALLKVKVDNYYVVTRFQNVMEFHVKH